MAYNEFEVLLQINNTDTLRKISLLDGLHTVERTMNFIISDNDKVSFIRQLRFDKNQPTTQQYYKKTVLEVENNKFHTFLYRVKKSRETPIPSTDFNSELVNIIRAKLRHSIILDKFPTWRIDFTFVHKSESAIDSNTLKTVKGHLLNNDYLWNVPIFLYELEIESLVNPPTTNYIDVIKHVFELIDIDVANNAMFREILAKIDNNITSVRKLTNPVIELSRNYYYNKVLNNINNYVLLHKADGVRTILMIDGLKVYCLNNSVMEIGRIKKSKKDDESDLKLTVVDGEFIKATKSFYLFDVIIYNGASQWKGDNNLNNRVSLIDGIISRVESKEVKLFKKKMFPLDESTLKDTLYKVWNRAKNNDYVMDGLIFTEIHKRYNKAISYKWKPFKYLTIDFFVKKANQPNIYYLFCGISTGHLKTLGFNKMVGYNKLFPNMKSHKYIPIQFQPSYIYKHVSPSDKNKPSKENPYNIKTLEDGKVYEFGRNENNSAWVVHRERTDRANDIAYNRYFGNNYRTAIGIWSNYDNPIKFEELSEKVYFKTNKSIIYKEMAGYNNKVKGYIIEKFKGVAKVIDVGSGKGQDILKLNANKIKKALMLDINQVALNELTNRLIKYQSSHGNMITKFYTKNLDLSKPVKEKLVFDSSSVDLMICHFAFHYFCKSIQSINNIISFAANMIKDEGYFSMITFDGHKIQEILKKNNGHYKVSHENKIKYSIKQLYKTDKVLSPAGQEIEVVLPFSKGEPYLEYLVNYDYVIEKFSQAGFKVVENNIITDIKEKIVKTPIAKDDLEYLGLHRYVIFQKSNKKGGAPMIINESRNSSLANYDLKSVKRNSYFNFTNKNRVISIMKRIHKGKYPTYNQEASLICNITHVKEYIYIMEFIENLIPSTLLNVIKTPVTALETYIQGCIIPSSHRVSSYQTLVSYIKIDKDNTKMLNILYDKIRIINGQSSKDLKTLEESKGDVLFFTDLENLHKCLQYTGSKKILLRCDLDKIKDDNIIINSSIVYYSFNLDNTVYFHIYDFKKCHYLPAATLKSKIKSSKKKLDKTYFDLEEGSSADNNYKNRSIQFILDKYLTNLSLDVRKKYMNALFTFISE